MVISSTMNRNAFAKSSKDLVRIVSNLNHKLTDAARSVPTPNFQILIYHLLSVLCYLLSVL